VTPTIDWSSQLAQFAPTIVVLLVAAYVVRSVSHGVEALEGAIKKWLTSNEGAKIHADMTKTFLGSMEGQEIVRKLMLHELDGEVAKGKLSKTAEGAVSAAMSEYRIEMAGLRADLKHLIEAVESLKKKFDERE
jgi:hypothetical protein